MPNAPTAKPATNGAKGKPGRPKKGETPEFDFGTLEFREAEMPKAPSSNPFTKPLGESYEYDTARAVVIPEAGQRRAEGLLRRAADELKIGVSITSGPATGTNDAGETITLAGMVEVIFKGKERRKRKSNETTTETAETAAPVDGENAPAAGQVPAAEDAAPANGNTDPSPVAPGSPVGAPAVPYLRGRNPT